MAAQTENASTRARTLAANMEVASMQKLRGGGLRDDLGVCDECGHETEQLYLMDGTWVCKGCAYVGIDSFEWRDD